MMLAGLNNGPGKEAVAWDSALLYDMIVTQPVVYRFPQIAVPTLLMIGQKDNTAIGKDLAPPEVRASSGIIPNSARRLPGRSRGRGSWNSRISATPRRCPIRRGSTGR